MKKFSPSKRLLTQSTQGPTMLADTTVHSCQHKNLLVQRKRRLDKPIVIIEKKKLSWNIKICSFYFATLMYV
jgi:hypothetical protein